MYQLIIVPVFLNKKPPFLCNQLLKNTSKTYGTPDIPTKTTESSESDCVSHIIFSKMYGHVVDIYPAAKVTWMPAGFIYIFLFLYLSNFLVSVNGFF